MNSNNSVSPVQICFETKQKDGYICVLKTAALSDPKETASWKSHVQNAISSLSSSSSSDQGATNTTITSIEDSNLGENSNSTLNRILADAFADESSAALHNTVLQPLAGEANAKKRKELTEFVYSIRLHALQQDSLSILHVASNSKEDATSTSTSTLIGHVAIKRSDTGSAPPSYISLLKQGYLKIPLYYGMPTTLRFFEMNKKIALVQKEVFAAHASEIPPDRKVYYASNLAISPDWQGQGIGGKIIEKLLDQKDEHEHKSGGEDDGNVGPMKRPCFFMTQEKKNVSLYERFGFRVIDHREITLTQGCQYKTPGPEDTFENWTMLLPAKK
jgi:GNAT superfamily N-acetyltransferase